MMALPAAAEAQSAAPARSPTADDRQELQSLPPQELRAMRHEQTREDDVRRLEDERYGEEQAKRLRSQQKDEVDQLYDQVLKQSEGLRGSGSSH
jgi:hypothetical protein